MPSTEKKKVLYLVIQKEKEIGAEKNSLVFARLTKLK
jgi:hypothetical protein